MFRRRSELAARTKGPNPCRRLWKREARALTLHPSTGADLAYYRLYHVRRGHFARFDEIGAEGDVEAVRLAGALVREDPAELWCGSRKVMEFPPTEGKG
jgi:hypothetical protein